MTPSMECLFFAVSESFDDYIAVELLEGDNRYDAGDYGLQVCQAPIRAEFSFLCRDILAFLTSSVSRYRLIHRIMILT